MLDIILSVIPRTIAAGTPLALAAIGEVVIERAGILNLGLEGIMLIGALTGFAVTLATSNLILGVLAGMIGGMLLALLHGYICISHKTKRQVVVGLMITFLAKKGLAPLLGRGLTGISISGFPAIKVPLPETNALSTILNHDPLVYLTFLSGGLIWWFLFRTKTGRIIRACGNRPEAVDMSGFNVSFYRYLAVAMGGCLAGLSGSYITLAQQKFWSSNITANQGWIAIALVIVSGWRPHWALGMAYLFGLVQVLQIDLQGTILSSHTLAMFPYAATIFVLCFTLLTRGKGKWWRKPRVLQEPYLREESVR